MPSMPPPLTVYGIVQDLGECIRQALADSPGGEPQRVCIPVPGQIADDACDCGQLALTVPRRYPSRVFPGEAVDDASQGPCGAPYLAFDVLVSVMRCAPSPDAQGNPPSCDELAQAALIKEADAWIMRQAAGCCLRDMEDADRIAVWLLRGDQDRGPSGSCVGVDLRLTIGIPHCTCPDSGS